MEYFAIEDFKRGRKKTPVSKRNKPKPTTTTKAQPLGMVHLVLTSQLRESRMHSRPLPAPQF